MKELNTLTKGFFNAGTITKIIIAGLIVLAFFGYLYLENKQGYTTLNEIQKSNTNIEALIKNLIEPLGEIRKSNVNIERLITNLVNQQINQKTLIKCINNAHKEAIKSWEDDFTIILGNVLKENKIIFPQTLNEAFKRFEEKLYYIKDCLILPEDKK